MQYMESIKGNFPIFKNNPGLVYLDNAATTQKPKVVLDSLNEFYSKYCSNVHRGLYKLSEKATDQYENARRTVAKFINAKEQEIIFTSGTTDSINSIVTSLFLSGKINSSSNVLLSDLEHHANILPFQRITKNLKYLPLTKDFQINTDYDFSNVDLLSLSLASNVTGAVLNANEVFTRAKKQNPKIICVLDAAQAVAHFKIDVVKINCDFLAFSGHKMFAPNGIGVIFGKKEILEELTPFRVGGGMIKEVYKDKAEWSDLPEKFEAGTPPIVEAIALGAAINYIKKISFKKIAEREKNLKNYLLKSLKEITEIKLFHSITNSLGVFSFAIDGVHPHDIADFLGQKNICLRAGHHCAQILHKEVLKVPATLRASLSIYNTKKDIDLLINELKNAIKVFKK